MANLNGSFCSSSRSVRKKNGVNNGGLKEPHGGLKEPHFSWEGDVPWDLPKTLDKEMKGHGIFRFQLLANRTVWTWAQIKSYAQKTIFPRLPNTKREKVFGPQKDT